jgi:hypothetical protein
VNTATNSASPRATAAAAIPANAPRTPFRIAQVCRAARRGEERRKAPVIQGS